MSKLETVQSLLTACVALLAEAKAEQPAACVASDSVARFVAENCFAIPGAIMTFAEFHKRFNAWSSEHYSKVRLARRLKELVPVGTRGANVMHVGNLSFTPVSPDRPYHLVDGKLRQR